MEATSMQVTRSQRMADIIHRNYMVLHILPRFGITMGFEDKTAEEICREHGINISFFLDIINSYLDSSYFPKKHLLRFPVNLIIGYLQKAHEDYLSTKIPRLESYIKSLIAQQYYDNKDYPQLLKGFFNEYKREFTDHLQREEEHVFPYVLKVEECFLTHKADAAIIEKIRSYSIIDYANEHDNIEDKLYDLKNIIIKYLPSRVDNDLCSMLLFELFRLERDLNDHARIENKIMVPKVQLMENWLLEKHSGLGHDKRNAARGDLKTPADEMNRPVQARADRSKGLSEREKEVLRFVALGLTNKVIADKLFISAHTVITHRKNISGKVGIKTIAGLTVYAVLNGLIDIQEIGR